MTNTKMECSKCGSSILESTAGQNSGLCKTCVAGPKIETVAEGMELGMRLLLGLFFAALVGTIGYGIGSFLGTIGGIIVTIPFAFFGFVYGCFCVEINAIIRTLLPFISDP
ncbi:hypothetical protein FF011L_11090 [Roseimaritima multifibrata]|uniref:Uncharacterized protein n=1 Tax=Roseimaritima multifibrata TaxID=1930274 RepID=A0A517MBV6_9BACT|nr:hypothetical protein [Roseimaritima multifibrata]QDS92366.1 hypothetical protein FF011L_11090 [Roseimaritima multifibrata]